MTKYFLINESTKAFENWKYKSLYKSRFDCGFYDLEQP